MKTIVVATDLSLPASHALNKAFRLAEITGAQLHVIHVLHDFSQHSMYESLGASAMSVYQRIREASQADLDDALAREAEGYIPPVLAEVLDGRPDVEILAYVDRVRADLLVIGAQGMGFVRELVLGSVATRLLRRSPVPVLLVKPDTPKQYQRALVAVDFSPASLALLAQVRQLAPVADVALTHVVELPYEQYMREAGVAVSEIAKLKADQCEQAKGKLQALLDKSGLAAARSATHVLTGFPLQELEQLTQEQGAQLVALGKHGRHFLEELLVGSVTRKLAARLPADVLVVTHGELPGMN